MTKLPVQYPKANALPPNGVFGHCCMGHDGRSRVGSKGPKEGPLTQGHKQGVGDERAPRLQ